MSSTQLSSKAALASAVIQTAIALNRSNREDLASKVPCSGADFLAHYGTVYLNLGQRSGTLSAACATPNSVVFLNEPEDLIFRKDSAGSRVELAEYNVEEHASRIEDFLNSHPSLDTIFIQGARSEGYVSRWAELHLDLCALYADYRFKMTFVII